ncbi:MAG: UvrD-helicase domain-containing protein [Anaerolineae bacterium]|nr:UvrD-helicase domain-containing protein [Anaerolineae bacterium]
MERTEAQRIAIEQHDQNLIVVAGAGSGKTYVLVERYLGLLDANRDWPLNALVAITFTKKAAQEMRDRVRQALEKRYATALDSVERDLWAGRIAAMQSARIDTIHGLCASILRANAAEADVDPQFEVLDEIQAYSFLDDTIDGVLQAVVTENDPAVRLLTEYEVSAVRQALIDFAMVNVPDIAADLMQFWRKQWEKIAKDAVSRLIEQSDFQAAAHWSPGVWPNDDDKLMAIWKGCRESLDVLQRRQDNLDLCLEALQTLVTTIKLTGGSAKNWGDKETLDVAKNALRTIREFASATQILIGETPGERDEQAAELLPLWVSLIRRAQMAYQQAKAAASYLDFDDLEHKTCKLLAEYPAAQARYQDAEFKHLLVDEFQDTNSAQWEIVRGLADLNQAGSLFVVGDPKQSIYAFRGADVSVFDHVRGKILEAGGGAVALARSFRTHHSLVESFNSVFQQILLRDLGSPVRDYEVELGEPMQATREAAPSESLPLEFLFIRRDGLDEEDDDAETRRRWEAYEIAQRLRHIVENEKRAIYDKKLQGHREIGFGDITLLFQSTSHITVYEDVFKAAGLPFVTIAGRGYYSRQEVWDLLNLLTALHNPADNLSLATTLRSPLFGLSDDALLALRVRRDVEGKRLLLWDALDDTENVPEAEIPKIIFARECLRKLHRRAGRVTISELLHAALDQTGYLATLTGLPDGARRRGNVEKLLDKAEISGQVTLGAFSQYLRDLSSREVREGEALTEADEAVKLMTVHASKGLEFPLVVLADVGWSRNRRETAPVILDPAYGLACRVYDPIEDKTVGTYAYQQAAHLQEMRELAERKRLLYVAMTRAQDYVLISGQLPLKDGKWKANTWLGWLWTALDFDSEPFESGLNIRHYDWGQAAISIPTQMPSDEAFILSEMGKNTIGWDQEAVREGRPLPGETVAPLLVQSVQVERGKRARHLTATQIADLGTAPYVPHFAGRFRRSVLHEAPEFIEQISQREPEQVSRRIIGEIVHRVLGIWNFVVTDASLRAYAWEQGVVDDGRQKFAVQEARKLLHLTLNSSLYELIESAQQVFRELPFIYKTDKRIIHGVLDVLLQREDGSWVVVDYKTSYVEGGQRDRNLVIEHARRYHLQVGVYAAAVRAQLNETVIPDVYIHYIRYGQTVLVPTDDWMYALAQLENTIGDLLDIE